MYKKIKFLVENLNMNIEESIGDFERSPNVLSTRKLENQPQFDKEHHSRLSHQKTPQKLEKIVKYYRVDKEGNRVEVEGPLTPNSNNLNVNSGLAKPFQENTVTPSKQYSHINRLGEMTLGKESKNELLSFTPIGIRGCL